MGADEAAVEVLRGFDERLVEFAFGIDEGAVFVPADANGEAVNRLAGFGGGEQYGEAFFDARLGAVGNGDVFAAGYGGDVGGGGVFAIEDDGGGVGAAGDEQGEQGFFMDGSLWVVVVVERGLVQMVGQAPPYARRRGRRIALGRIGNSFG